MSANARKYAEERSASAFCTRAYIYTHVPWSRGGGGRQLRRWLAAAAAALLAEAAPVSDVLRRLRQSRISSLGDTLLLLPLLAVLVPPLPALPLPKCGITRTELDLPKIATELLLLPQESKRERESKSEKARIYVCVPRFSRKLSYARILNFPRSMGWVACVWSDHRSKIEIRVDSGDECYV